MGTDDSDIAYDFKEEERDPERMIRGRAGRGHRRPVPPGKERQVDGGEAEQAVDRGEYQSENGKNQPAANARSAGRGRSWMLGSYRPRTTSILCTISCSLAAAGPVSGQVID